MKKIVLHIGAGKCGSSALQTHLSTVPVLKTKTGEVLKYGALGVDGCVSTGALITEKASSSIFQYSSSVLLTNTVDEDFDTNLMASLEKVDADILVLSCEGWLGQHVAARGKFQCLADISIEVLVYVRPPVEWLNSAWWQWGAWNKVDFDKWFGKSLPNTFWSEYIRGWQHSNVADNILIKNMPKDIVSDFYSTYGIPETSSSKTRSNTSLPGSVLRLFQQYSDLRPSAHEPQIDFTVSRRLTEISSRPDWVISKPKIKEALVASEPYNHKLSGIMCAEQRKVLQENPAWWDEEYYHEKPFQDPTTRVISELEKNLIMYHSISSLHKAESEIINLKNRLRILAKKNQTERC